MTPLNGGERSGGRPACGIGVPIRTDLDLEEVVVGCRGGGREGGGAKQIGKW
jgi:hypothetical protein